MKATRWQEDVQQLQHFRLFQNVAAASLEQLLTDFCACELETGEVVLTPFSRNNFLYMVLRGELKVYLGSLDNHPVSVVPPGECAGEISFIDNNFPSAYVVASQPTIVLRLHRESLLGLMQRCPEFMQNLLELLCQRVRQGNRIILDTEANANIDTLTGLFNRRWLEHVYDREKARCVLNMQPLCMLMLDVDHFKDYNDQHGHLAGDYALILVAHTFRNQLRPKDSMARFGGEEFVILLPEVGIDEARSIGDRLRLSLEHVTSFYSPVGVLPGVTVSLGVAQMDGCETLASLILRADNALYQAKQCGRNCLCG
ncbi:putative diguanylate cyclase YdaM [compost metagenome]|uniref:diguanylate cyclase n=1 Tax=Pseudomonas jinjuensis TaxID=198616 RepID=A0A1H0HFN0_9PSED|nr:GGDEF domain-containing protein [Pseudomonas jinjuensis]SDO17900.1 diguanylate cyclase (GGDEF) domain-containing protein [Pseudomonas jinjuensis]